MVLRTLLIPKGQKGVEKGEELVNTSRRREKRGKTQEASTVNFGVWNALNRPKFHIRIGESIKSTPVARTFFLAIPFVKGLANSLSVRARYTLTVPFRAL
ncbi:hypothetical protein MTR_5g005645 [Medicago truncatula]|uniref:Uncharacterized protein n=1 Tax=Medicago truncatula TaxID=3880 RepID=A0A072UBZ2_MEDTR|nr:hypothetical protein MTR_5g005645 [Medicago truncatula]